MTSQRAIPASAVFSRWVGWGGTTPTGIDFQRIESYAIERGLCQPNWLDAVRIMAANAKMRVPEDLHRTAFNGSLQPWLDKNPDRTRWPAWVAPTIAYRDWYRTFAKAFLERFVNEIPFASAMAEQRRGAWSDFLRHPGVLAAVALEQEARRAA